MLLQTRLFNYEELKRSGGAHHGFFCDLALDYYFVAHFHKTEIREGGPCSDKDGDDFEPDICLLFQVHETANDNENVARRGSSTPSLSRMIELL